MALTHHEHVLPRTAANHAPLSPLSFIRRARNVFPEHPAVIYGERRYSWREVHERAGPPPDAGERLGSLSYETLLEPAIPTSPGSSPTTSGGRSRSTALRAPAGGRKASSTTTAAPI